MVLELQTKNKDLKLPNRDKLPLQGAMFIGEKGRLLLPHFMERPQDILLMGSTKKLTLKNTTPMMQLGNTENDYERDAPETLSSIC